MCFKYSQSSPQLNHTAFNHISFAAKQSAIYVPTLIQSIDMRMCLSIGSLVERITQFWIKLIVRILNVFIFLMLDFFLNLICKI